MTIQKPKIFGLTMLLLLAATILVSCVRDSMNPEEISLPIDFIELIENGSFNDLSLTIYYRNPAHLIRSPLSEEELTKRFQYNVTVSGEDLEKHKDLLNQLIHAKLLSVEKESGLDARLFYVFETKNGDRIFRVSMSVEDNTMFVNGRQVKENDIFYEVVMPFLPKDAVEKLEEYLRKEKK